MDVTIQSIRILEEMKKQSKQFTEDNYTNPTPSDFTITLSAFMCGAAIALMSQAEDAYNDSCG